jgi:hypothetical protein
MAFVLGNASELGQVKFEGNHVLFAEGLGAQFNFPNDFTVSFSASTATVTYNGTTSIPAGSVVKLQLETAGENNYLTDNRTAPEVYRDYLGNLRAVAARPVRVLFGAIATASTTNILATTAVADTVLHTLTTPFVLDVPRGLAIVSSTTDTTQSITIRGFDEYGVAMSEKRTLNGATPVLITKAFKTVVSYQADIAMAGNLSIGTRVGGIGMPFFLPGGTGVSGLGQVVKEIQDNANATPGVFIDGDLTKATLATGDVRGTWTPNATPDGAKVFEVVLFASDTTFRGVPQFGT